MGFFTLLFICVTIYCIMNSLFNGDVKEALNIFSHSGKTLLFLGAMGVIFPIMYSVLGVFGLILSAVFAFIIMSKYLSF